MTNKAQERGVINALRGNILEALATFKYLVPSQLMQLGVGTTQIDYLRKNLRWLRDRRRPYADCIVYGSPDPRKGSVENLWFLVEEGKNTCIESLFMDEDKVRMPIGKPPAYKDYYHRRGTVDFHIALHQWAMTAGWEIELFDTYFDKIGSNRNSGKYGSMRTKNRVTLSENEFLIPDASTIIQHESGRKELFLFELHRTKKHTKKLINQIYQHCQAQELGVPQRMYDLEQPYQVLIVFEFESAKQATIKRIKDQQQLAVVREYFLCKSLDELYSEPFFEGWQTLSGKIVTLLE